jgi:uncharacterized membrane protein
MATNVVRTRDKDTLAQFLGWFSVGLGAAQVAMPRAMCKLIGSTGEGRAPLAMRAMGMRELTQGAGILARPRPTAWLWSRVVGDALDLAALAVVAVRNPGRRGRTAFAIANVAAVAIPDVLESRTLARKDGPVQEGRPIRKAVTINRPRDEVEEAWATADHLQRLVEDAGAAVTYADAPAGQGTELAVEWVDAPKGGDLGAAARKLTGNDLATELADGLRRLKQRIETGEVVRSDSTPDGHLLANHLKQRPAQPLEEVSQ